MIRPITGAECYGEGEGKSMRAGQLVTSSCVCKNLEGAGFPFQVESLEDGVDDAVHAFHVHKAHHGPSSVAHFHEAALDHVGGAQFMPQMSGKGEEQTAVRASLALSASPQRDNGAASGKNTSTPTASAHLLHTFVPG